MGEAFKGFDGRTVLVTGGTGSFGKCFIKYVTSNYNPKKLIILSRDELKQHEISQKYPPKEFPYLRFFLGDVRDLERLKQAFSGVDYIVHAAALKQVPAAEYNPFEFVKTNIIGAENIVNAAIYNNVKKVIALSTDKAVNPVNLYGTTKLASDKIFVAGNSMSGQAPTRFSIVRYGNVVGSRGSVIPLFQKLVNEGKKVIPLTDKRMTRFWITLDQGVKFVISTFSKMTGGEIFVPKIPSMSILDLARTMAPEAQIETVGIRPGEKLHEVMVPKDEARNTLEFKDYYLIQPALQWWDQKAYFASNEGTPVKEEFEYCSNTNPMKLSPEKLKSILSENLAGADQ